MKRFFMRGSDDELKFGDIIELNFTKDLENGHTHHCHMECKFLPEIVPLLLEHNIIEVKEFKDKKDDAPANPKSDDTCSTLQESLATIESLELKVEKLENAVVALRNIVRKLQRKDARKSA